MHRNCPGCLRRTATDTIPARTLGGVTVRPFELCAHCGWVYPECETKR